MTKLSRKLSTSKNGAIATSSRAHGRLGRCSDGRGVCADFGERRGLHRLGSGSLSLGTNGTSFACGILVDNMLTGAAGLRLWHRQYVSGIGSAAFGISNTVVRNQLERPLASATPSLGAGSTAFGVQNNVNGNGSAAFGILQRLSGGIRLHGGRRRSNTFEGRQLERVRHVEQASWRIGLAQRLAETIGVGNKSIWTGFVAQGVGNTASGMGSVAQGAGNVGATARRRRRQRRPAGSTAVGVANFVDRGRLDRRRQRQS